MVYWLIVCISRQYWPTGSVKNSKPIVTHPSSRSIKLRVLLHAFQLPPLLESLSDVNTALYLIIGELSLFPIYRVGARIETPDFFFRFHQV